MTHVLTIAARELRERNRIFIAAVAFAILPFVTALLPGAKTMGRGTVIALVGGFLAVTMALGTSVALGASVIGRELSEKRLSFFFAKPISAAAIWWGKVIGSLLASTLAFLIIVLPSLSVGFKVWRSAWVDPLSLIPATVGLIIVLFFVSHVASTMIRSRSALLGLDVLLLAATVYALYLLAEPLIRAMAMTLIIVLLDLLAVAFFLILAIAPVFQLSRGRTDRVRSHRALSLAIWASVGVVLLIAGLVVGWVVSASPGDLTKDIGIEQSPDGRTVLLGGTAENRLDYHASFVLDESGAQQRIVSPPWWSVAFSRDGRVMVWRTFPIAPWNEEMELMVWRRGQRPKSTGLRLTWQWPFVLSADGSRLAVVDGNGVAVHDIASDRLVASFKVPGLQAANFFFVTSDLLRVATFEVPAGPPGLRKAAPSVRVIDFDLRSRTSREIANVEAEVRSVGFSPNGRLMLVRGSGKVVDLATGQVVQTVATPTSWAPWSVLLDDGTVVARRKDGQDVAWEISTADGTVKRVPVPGMTQTWLAGITSSGEVVVSMANAGRTPRRVGILDPRSGALTHVAEGVARANWGWSADPRPQRTDPARIAAIDPDGTPQMVNLLTGERRPLVRE